MVWGPMIAWYLFLAGASAGAFLTSAFVEVKYPESVKMRVAGRIIAPIFVGIGLLMLMLDAEAGLHNPLRFFWLISNPGSVMTLGVYFICVYMPVALAVAVLEILKKRVPKWLTWTGIVAAFAVAAYTGFLLGVVKAFPLWNNAILPILFVVSALSAGLAATSLVGLIVDRERFEQMWLIKKFLFKPVQKVLAQRQQMADAQIADAEKARTEAEAMRTDYEQRLADAKEEAAQLVQNATRTAQLRSARRRPTPPASRPRRTPTLPSSARRPSMRSRTRSAASPWTLLPRWWSARSTPRSIRT